MTSSVRTFKKAGIEINDGCLLITTDNINDDNKHYNVIVYHDTINNIIRVTADKPLILYFFEKPKISIDLVDNNSIEEYSPLFSKIKKKRVKSGYVEFKETTKIEYTATNFIIEEKK